MSSARFAFGDVTVDVARVEVRRAGRVASLEPKAFDVLAYLLEHRDRLVTKEELLAVVWKDTFVTVNVLTRAVAQLRKALGDDAFEARYIQTVARRGYRFVAAVERPEDAPSARAAPAPEADAGPAPTAVPARPSASWRRASLATLLALLALAGGWGLARWRATGSGGAAANTLRRITSVRSSYLLPCISPDGSSVAYSSGPSGAEDIYVAGLAPGSREVAITTDASGNVHATFSPDGRWLAYRSSTRGGVWVVPATGGTPRRVAEFGTEPAWSPDSQTIVFTSLGGLSSQATLWTVRLDGTPPSSLTSLGNPPGGHVEPSWSHGGGLIAFRVSRHEEREIWVVDAKGAGRPRLLATINKSSPPAFSPDGRFLYWVGTTPERNDCLMRLALDDAGAPAGRPETVLPFPGAEIGRLTIARDGTALVHWSRLSVKLYAVDLAASGEAAGPPHPLTGDEETIQRYASYGPDGRVLYEQEAPGGPIAVWVIGDDGRNAELLSPGRPESVRTPQWGPGGRVFAIVEPGQGQRPFFAWIDPATKQSSRIALEAAGASTQPRLSPDGQQLAYHVLDPATGVVNVWVRRLDGGPPRQITFDTEAISYPRWSQDGRWIAANVKRGEDTQVGVVPAEGGPLELLTSGRGTRWPSSFSPGGERVAFAATEPGGRGWNIYSVSRRTREVQQLTRFTSGRALFPAWSPRGDRIVFSHAEARGSLWTLRLPRE